MLELVKLHEEIDQFIILQEGFEGFSQEATYMPVTLM